MRLGCGIPGCRGDAVIGRRRRLVDTQWHASMVSTEKVIIGNYRPKRTVALSSWIDACMLGDPVALNARDRATGFSGIGVLAPRYVYLNDRTVHFMLKTNKFGVLGS
jgi:hypothetical protein